MDYFLPHKALSLVMLIFFVIAWRQTYRNRTCLTVLPRSLKVYSAGIVLFRHINSTNQETVTI